MHNTFTSYRIDEFYFRFLSVVIKDDLWIIAFCGIRAYDYNTGLSDFADTQVSFGHRKQNSSVADNRQTKKMRE